MSNRTSFGTRILAVLMLVAVTATLCAWGVGALLAPGIFHDHLDMVGLSQDSAEAAHMEEAFQSSMMVSWAVALAVSLVLSLIISGYIARRLLRSLSPVTESVREIAGGNYGSRVARPGIGREFDDLVTSFNELARRLDAAETTRTRMLADLAHEMRTPLATIDSHLEAVEDGVRRLDANTLTILRTATGRLGRLARDIGAVSRAEEHLTRLSLTHTDTHSVITGAVDALRPEYEAKGVELATDIDRRVPLSVDRDRIGQVLGNLLQNALRHTPPGGTVTVTGRHGEGLAQISVTDTGEGIEPQHLDRLFDRFYRVGTARDRRHGGSGIGLTISRALAEAHGGRLRASSDGPGRGARFVLELPVDRPEAPARRGT